MRRQLEGSRAVALTVARCRPEVVCAYPISPQTHIVEALAELVDVPLQAVAICADLDHNVFNAAHTDPKVGEALRNTHWFELREWATRGPGQAA